MTTKEKLEDRMKNANLKRLEEAVAELRHLAEDKKPTGSPQERQYLFLTRLLAREIELHLDRHLYLSGEKQ